MNNKNDMAFNKEPVDLNTFDHIVFDIETVPFLDNEYSETQREYVQRKLTQSLTRNSAIDPIAEEKKIKGIDPYLSKIICLGLKMGNAPGYALIGEEATILEKFWAVLKTQYKPLFISYNGIKFDVPYIIRRSMKHRIKPTNIQFPQITKFIPFPPHFDVMQQFSGRDAFYSLKQACDFFGVPSPKDGAVAAENVADAFYSGRISEIAEYCVRDLESTYTIFKLMQPYAVAT
jgi:predicted PolB exonuclease-like 3'-5' exonuclease